MRDRGASCARKTPTPTRHATAAVGRYASPAVPAASAAPCELAMNARQRALASRSTRRRRRCSSTSAVNGGSNGVGRASHHTAGEEVRQLLVATQPRLDRCQPTQGVSVVLRAQSPGLLPLRPRSAHRSGGPADARVGGRSEDPRRAEASPERLHPAFLSPPGSSSGRVASRCRRSCPRGRWTATSPRSAIHRRRGPSSSG